MSRSTKPTAPAATSATAPAEAPTAPTAPAPAPAPGPSTPAKATRATAIAAFEAAVKDPSTAPEAVAAAFAGVEGPGRVVNEAFGLATAAVMAPADWLTDPAALAFVARASMLKAAVEAAVAAARPTKATKAADPAAEAKARVEKAKVLLAKSAVIIAKAEAEAQAVRAKVHSIEGITEADMAAASDWFASAEPVAIFDMSKARASAGTGAGAKATLDMSSLVAGTVLEHEFRDGTLATCTYEGPTRWVTSKGTFTSATAAAKAYTGSSVNGLAFWSLA